MLVARRGSGAVLGGGADLLLSNAGGVCVREFSSVPPASVAAPELDSCRAGLLRCRSGAASHSRLFSCCRDGRGVHVSLLGCVEVAVHGRLAQRRRLQHTRNAGGLCPGGGSPPLPVRVRCVCSGQPCSSADITLRCGGGGALLPPLQIRMWVRLRWLLRKLLLRCWQRLLLPHISMLMRCGLFCRCRRRLRCGLPLL